MHLTADLLKQHIRQYIFISSISAYADLAVPGIDENYKLVKLTDPTVEVVNAETDGGLKAPSEQVVEQIYGANAAVIRATYIAGPGDTTDRFTYWPVRVSLGGEMLAPGSLADPIQFIDVRDLADFLCLCVERHLEGRFNVCDRPRAVTMGSLLDACRRITGVDTEPVRRSSGPPAPSAMACSSVHWKRRSATRSNGTGSDPRRSGHCGLASHHNAKRTCWGCCEAVSLLPAHVYTSPVRETLRVPRKGI